MATSAQEIFESAMSLMDELDDNGAADTSDTAEYKNRVLSILNILAPELYPYSDTYEIDELNERPIFRWIKNMTEALDLDDYCCRTVLPYGLAAHLVLDENPSAAGYFQQRYDELKDSLKRGIPKMSADIEDCYGEPWPYNDFGRWV
jgi:hypothetical protein